MAVSTFIFDMGDILYDATAWRKWLHAYLFERKLIDLDYWSLFDIWEERFLSVIHKDQIEYHEGFEKFLRYLKLKDNEIADLLAVNWDMKKKLESESSVFPEVPETLARLKELGITTCVLTDTELNQQQIRGILKDRLGINESIDIIVSSHEIGHRKPEQEAFEACFEVASTPIEECVFVAHDEDELTGANEIGLRTIAYNYREPVEASFKITNFSEIIDLLKNL